MKHILRSKLKVVRDGLDAEYRKSSETEINRHIQELVAKLNSKCIAAYYPINSEVDISPALSKLENTIVLPAISGDKLSFIKWSVGEKLVKRGVCLEPTGIEKAFPDTILLPALGFDERGGRIGYGLGYYDKTLPHYPHAKKVIVAYSKQKLLEIPMESHDIRADFIITEEGIFECHTMKN